MKEEHKPICTFSKLREELAQMGIEVGEAHPYHNIGVVDIGRADIGTTIRFTKDGIIYTDPKTKKEQQVFLYKRKYKLTEYGKPRYHICECKIIKDFKNSGTFEAEYRAANSEVVKVIDLEDWEEEKDVSDLPLCQYCANIVFGKRNNLPLEDYVDSLKGTDTDNEEVDIFGYTKNWEKISRAYRKKQNYTCEKCGLEITNNFDKRFIHVHHKNGEKTDNRVENLQCLCIRCHSEIDDRHRENFSSGDQTRQLEAFNKKYPR